MSQWVIESEEKAIAEEFDALKQVIDIVRRQPAGARQRIIRYAAGMIAEPVVETKLSNDLAKAVADVLGRSNAKS